MTKPAPNPSSRATTKSNSLTGDCGEHFVVAEMLRRGWLAALAPRNSTAWDVLATRGERVVKVRVKATTRASAGWVWGLKKSGDVLLELRPGALDDFTVLVSLGDLEAPPRYFVAASAEVEALVARLHSEWRDTPGRSGQPHNPTSVRQLLERQVPATWLANWHALE